MFSNRALALAVGLAVLPPPAPLEMFTRLALLLAIALGFGLAAQVLVGMPPLMGLSGASGLRVEATRIPSFSDSVKTVFAVGSCLFIGQDRCGRWVVRDAQSRAAGRPRTGPRRSDSPCTNASAARNPSSCCPAGLEFSGAAPVFTAAPPSARAA